MTDTPSAAMDPDPVNNRAGAAARVHALPNGEIEMWLDGRFGPVPRASAVSVMTWLDGSPIPASQARAGAIRAALQETMQ